MELAIKLITHCWTSNSLIQHSGQVNNLSLIPLVINLQSLSNYRPDKIVCNLGMCNKISR